MVWKRSIDDIRIVCKSCNKVMVNESSFNLIAGIFVCPRCKDKINVEVK